MVRKRKSRATLQERVNEIRHSPEPQHDQQSSPQRSAPATRPTDSSSTSSASYGGFVVSACTHIAFALYILWAFLPDAFIQALGISWYPHRDWALLLPSWLTMLVVSVYIGYAALNIYDTPAIYSLAHLTDAFALIQDPPQEVDQEHPLVANSASALPQDAIPALYDMPLAVYNQVAFDYDE